VSVEINKMYGFYSADAEERYGYAIYSSQDGRELKVTFAISDPSIVDEHYHFEDKLFVGQLGDFINSYPKNQGRKWDAVWMKKGNFVDFILCKKSRLRRERF
jgi:hypothetical protein